MAGLGALAYILQGIGGVGEGLAANQEAARKQQLVDLERQRIEQQGNVNMLNVSPELSTMLGAAGTPIAAGQNIDARTLPIFLARADTRAKMEAEFAMEQRKRAQAVADQNALLDFYRAAQEPRGGQNPTIAPEGAPVAAGVPAGPMPRDEMLAGLLGRPRGPEFVKDMGLQIDPTERYIEALKRQGIDIPALIAAQQGGAPGGGPAGGGRPMVPTFTLGKDPSFTLRGEATSEQEQRARNYLADWKTRDPRVPGPGEPGYGEMLYNAAQQFVMPPEGSPGVFPRSSAVPIPAGLPGAPGALPSGPGGGSASPALTVPQKPMDSTQQQTLERLDTSIGALKQLTTALRENADIADMVGGITSGKAGVYARKAEEGVKMGPLGQVNYAALTDEQRKALATYSAMRLVANKAMEGLRPNLTMIQMASDALSGWDQPGMPAKLEGLMEYFQNERASLQNVGEKSNRLVPTPPGTPPSSGGAARGGEPSGLPAPPPNVTLAPGQSLVWTGKNWMKWTGSEAELQQQYPGFRMMK